MSDNKIDLNLCGLTIHIKNNDVEVDLNGCDSKLVIDDGNIKYNGQQIGDSCDGQNNVVINCGCGNNNCNCNCNK